MDSLGSLNVFVQVAETRSFAAAGRLLGVSASAVGKSVSRLEESLGVRLFHRSTRSLALTAEGALLLERSRRILGEVKAVEAELTRAGEVPRGRLRVSLPLVGSLILPVLTDFMHAYPDVQLDLDFTDRLVDVIEEGFDVVLRTGDPADSRLRMRTLGDFRRVLVGSPDYFARRGRPRHPADLAAHACLHYRNPTSGKLEVWPLRSGKGDPELYLPASMVCNNIETRVCFAMNGLGIACLPDYAIREALDAGALVTVLDDYMHASGTFRLMWPAAPRMAPKLRAFVDFLDARVFPAKGAAARAKRRSAAGRRA